MSPTSSSSSTIYDHLMINFPQQPKIAMRTNTNASNNIYDNSNKFYSSNSKTDCDNLLVIKKTQSLPLDQQQRTKRRYTITHIPVPEPIVRCSVSNQAYEKAIIRKPVTTSNISSTWKETNGTKNTKTNPKYFHSPLSSNIEVKPMDFRPLIINGRRRFSTISSASPMIIIKKKSPSPMNNIFFDQKPLPRSIPVNITSSNTPMVVSTVIPSSLSYSSSCSCTATSASSTNVRTVSVPIQVIKTQKNNNKTNSTSTTNTTDVIIESQKGYRYIQKQPQEQQLKPLLHLKAGNQVQPLPIPSDDDDESTKMPSSSSGDGDGNNYNSTVMTDSHVLRLIRRYDPAASSTTGIKTRCSLESTRSVCHTNPPKLLSSLSSNASSSSCSFLPQRTLNSTYEDNISVKQPSTPRLQRQKAIHEQEPSPSTSSLPSSNVTNSVRPILKYISPTPRAELNVQPKKTEPLIVEIEPHVSPSPSTIVNENTTIYQPLITTGTKRVCAAVSKSEWDLRLQHDLPSTIAPPPPFSNLPVQPPSSRTTINQQQENASYRPLLNRSKSSIGINNNNEEDDDDTDDFDEKSAPITAVSCVERLKQLFITKSSLDLTNSPINKQDRVDSIESNLSRHLNTNGTNINKSDVISSASPVIQRVPRSNLIESQARTIPNGNLTKPTTIIQETIPTSSPLLKRPILKSQKTLDSTESLNRLNTSSTMPSSELSCDAYRFRRLNDHDQMTTTRLRNVAKVEPYSINTNMVRPLYQSSSLQPTSTIVPSKARIILNSMGNTPTNSSTSSSAASLGGTIRHPNVRHSDFLVPNPAYSTAPPLHTPQSLSNSSSYTTPPSTSILLSESLSHGSSHRLPNMNNTSLYNTRSTGLTSSTNNSPQKYQSSTQGDFHSGKQTYSPSIYHNSNSTITNNNKFKKFDNYTPPNSYHYRPKEFASSTTAINTSLTNGRQPSQGPLRSTIVEQQDERSSGGQHQSRRRFQRRKEMKRSKSADLYQEPSSISSKNQNNNNYLFTSTNNNEQNKSNRRQRSISRDLSVGEGGRGGDGNLSSSSTSSSSIANIERINRAALLRYKSLDSVTFNNRKSNLNGKTNNRRALSKPSNADFDSDDSVCGIPKPRKTIGR